MTLINLGSGQRRFPKPWINVDINPQWEPDVVADGAHMPMFADASASMIVIEHTLEHYGCGEGTAMLQECYRILAPGSSLVVTVPDMRQLVRGWITGNISTQIFFTNVYGAYNGDEADRHRWGFAPETLTELLFSAAPWSYVDTFSAEEDKQHLVSHDWWILERRAIK